MNENILDAAVTTLRDVVLMDNYIVPDAAIDWEDIGTDPALTHNEEEAETATEVAIKSVTAIHAQVMSFFSEELIDAIPATDDYDINNYYMNELYCYAEKIAMDLSYDALYFIRVADNRSMPQLTIERETAHKLALDLKELFAREGRFKLTKCIDSADEYIYEAA